MSSDVSWRREICDEDLIFRNGCLQIPDKPGLGVDLDEEAILRHPYQPHDLRHYTGALTDIRPPEAMPYWHTHTQ